MPNEQNDQKLAPSITEQEKRDVIEVFRKTYSELRTDPTDSKLLNEYADLYLTKNKTEKQEKKLEELMNTLGHIHTLRNGLFLYNMTNTAEKSKAIIEIRRSLVREYQNPNDSELILIDQIVAAYWRARQYEIYLNRMIEPEVGHWSYNQLKINMAKELHRGLDQANRQIALNLGLLRQGRQPNLNIKVNTENAYIGQNQQVINQVKPKKNEETAINAK